MSDDIFYFYLSQEIVDRRTDIGFVVNEPPKLIGKFAFLTGWPMLAEAYAHKDSEHPEERVVYRRLLQSMEVSEEHVEVQTGIGLSGREPLLREMANHFKVTQGQLVRLAIILGIDQLCDLWNFIPPWESTKLHEVLVMSRKRKSARRRKKAVPRPGFRTVVRKKKRGLKR